MKEGRLRFLQTMAFVFSLLCLDFVGPAEASPPELAALSRTVQELESQMAATRSRVDEQAKVIESQGKAIAELRSQLSGSAEGAAAAKQEPGSLKDQVQAVLQEFRLSEKTQTQDENALVTSYDDGFYLKGKDDTIKIGAWVQGDLNVYEKGNEGNTRFRNRRVRLDLRGVLEDDFEYRLYPQFAGSSANLQEAWLMYKYFPSARLKMGQFKVPFSMESQYSIRWLDFIERSIGVSNLQPAEDVGVMLFGNPLHGKVEYGVGLFNGRLRTNEDNNDSFDVASRVVFAPFKDSQHELLRDLYGGGSVTWGNSDESLAGTGFTTAGGSSFFTYASSARHADDRTRFGGELQWIYGPTDVKAEYLSARFADVERLGRTETANTNAWYVSLSRVLTGEHKLRNKPLVPKENFSPALGNWGAWEAALRFEQFFVNDALLSSGFATGTDRVDSFTVGLNGWLNRHVRVMFNYVFNHFADAVLLGAETENKENLFLARVQYNF